MKPLTLQEACNILGIDNATLYRWLQRANIKPETDRHDRRRHTISHAQLTHLARLHHRLLPEKTRQALQSDREALRPSQMEEVISPTEERIETLERRINALESRVSDLEAQGERKTPAPAPKVLKPPAPTYEITASGALPDGWIPLYDLMKQYQTPSRSTVFRQMKDFIQTGQWIFNGHEVTNALDAEGQAEFRRRYAPRE